MSSEPPQTFLWPQIPWYPAPRETQERRGRTPTVPGRRCPGSVCVVGAHPSEQHSRPSPERTLNVWDGELRVYF